MKGKTMRMLFPITAFLFMLEFMFIQVENYNYDTVDRVFKNPMMGFAPCADSKNEVGDNTLVYVDVTWKELEPAEGEYDFEGIDREKHLEQWREEGKQVVFRFVCDKPGDEKHMDIPEWLYEKTKDGTFYSCSYGQGYSPDYTNKTFIAYHEKAIHALGEQYGQDSFFYFIELGSLGHWGEWHVNYAAGIDPFPEEKVCQSYVKHYIEAFPNSKLMMRRPFSFVTDYGMGVFNDMTGHEEGTKEWLNWIHKGGVYEEAKKPMKLIPCGNVWESYPVGGEFTSSISMEELLVEEQKRTISLLRESHMTFIGPKCPEADGEELEYPKESAKILKNIGYRYGVTNSKITYNKLFKTAMIEFTMKNHGVAPMYEPWKVCLYALDEQGEVLKRYETDMNLKKILQKQTNVVKLKIADKELLKDGMVTIAVGIENPETGKPAVYLDMDTKEEEKRYYLN